MSLPFWSEGSAKEIAEKNKWKRAYSYKDPNKKQSSNTWTFFRFIEASRPDRISVIWPCRMFSIKHMVPAYSSQISTFSFSLSFSFLFFFLYIYICFVSINFVLRDTIIIHEYIFVFIFIFFLFLEERKRKEMLLVMMRILVTFSFALFLSQI